LEVLYADKEFQAIAAEAAEKDPDIKRKVDAAIGSDSAGLFPEFFKIFKTAFSGDHSVPILPSASNTEEIAANTDVSTD
jgi:hypothetical protein